MVAASSELLRIAAKYADMTHWFPIGMDTLKHKTEVLDGYCGEIGRDPAQIERTMGAPVVPVALTRSATRSWPDPASDAPR